MSAVRMLLSRAQVALVLAVTLAAAWGCSRAEAARAEGQLRVDVMLRLQRNALGLIEAECDHCSFGEQLRLVVRAPEKEGGQKAPSAEAVREGCDWSVDVHLLHVHCGRESAEFQTETVLVETVISADTSVPAEARLGIDATAEMQKDRPALEEEARYAVLSSCKDYCLVRKDPAEPNPGFAKGRKGTDDDVEAVKKECEVEPAPGDKETHRAELRCSRAEKQEGGVLVTLHADVYAHHCGSRVAAGWLGLRPLPWAPLRCSAG